MAVHDPDANVFTLRDGKRNHTERIDVGMHDIRPYPIEDLREFTNITHRMLVWRDNMDRPSQGLDLFARNVVRVLLHDEIEAETGMVCVSEQVHDGGLDAALVHTAHHLGHANSVIHVRFTRFPQLLSTPMRTNAYLCYQYTVEVSKTKVYGNTSEDPCT